MPFAGTTVGIPLTLLQLGLHVGHHPSVHIGAWDVLQNACLGHAIYDADRLPPEAPRWQRATTSAAALVATAGYAAHPETAALAPCVLALHAGYASAKPCLAPIKPWVVGTCWTAAVYAAPLWRAHESLATIDGGWATSASLLLGIAALSHAADIRDAAEDAAVGLQTPAVAMAPSEARLFALGLAGAAAFVHAGDAGMYDAAVLAATVAVAYESAAAATAILVASTVGYVLAHDLQLVALLLRSTEVTHKLAIHALLETVERARALPPPLRRIVVDATMAALAQGDALGSRMLDLYETLVRQALL